MKVVVVGGVAGGASAAARVRRLDAKAQIKVFEKGQYVSFSNCSLPYYLSSVVEDSEDLIMMDPEEFKTKHDIDVATLSEVTDIDRENKTVTVKDLRTGESYSEAYDKLILSPGASPILPRSIRGIDSKNVFTVRNVGDVVGLKNRINMDGAENIVVVGGGFIGLEVAENLIEAGKKVTLIEGTDQIMAPVDYDMAQILHKEMDDHGVTLYLSATVTAIEDDKVIAEKDGKELQVPADAVVMAIGVAPETQLAQKAGLEIGQTRGIKVNHNYQTSDPDIYAVGDVIESFNKLTKAPGRLALAGPAQRQARAAADHIILGKDNEDFGFIGSSVIKLFGLNAASTGLNEKTARAAGMDFDSVLIFPNDKVSLMPGARYMAFKLVFSVPDGKILGAQAIGAGDVDKRIDVIAAMITMGASLEDLKDLELCYAPPFSTAKDVVNMAAMVALNILSKRFRQVHVDQVRGLVESGAYILDVREEGELKRGRIKGSHNIPLSRLRERMNEIPKDVPVYVHCRSSQRSYYAVCCLQGYGYDNVVNISGSFLGICLYEYFNDKTTGREPIVTDYNFR